MVYRGKVRGGVVVFPPGVSLPDGLDVTVEAVIGKPIPSSPDRVQMSMRNGVPVFPRRECIISPGLELVNNLRDGRFREWWALHSNAP